MGLIYKITTPSGKIYVGKTSDLRKRINSHKCSAKAGRNIILHSSIRKYGWDAHILEIIEEVDDEILNEREVFWIRELKSYCHENPNGCNMTLGGEGQRSTWMHKKELRKWFSDRFSGEGNPFYGKKHTDATKKELSEKAAIRQRATGRSVPRWGTEKGRLKTIVPVVAFNDKGDLIGEYESLVACAKQLGVSYSSVNSAISKTWVSGKYFVDYEANRSKFVFDASTIKKQTVRRPVICFINSYKIEYPSALEASVDLGVPKSTINRQALNTNGRPMRSGYGFIYKDLQTA